MEQLLPVVPVNQEHIPQIEVVVEEDHLNPDIHLDVN